MAKSIIVKSLDSGDVEVVECVTEHILGEEFDWCNEVLNLNPAMNKYFSDNELFASDIISNLSWECLIDRVGGTISGNCDWMPFMVRKLPTSKVEFDDLEKHMINCLREDKKLMDAFRVFTLSLLHQVTKDFIDD